ncbi:hypothetical protein BG32_09635 [Mesotoga sp. HF07.pep.5.2.highcov]|uniref:pyruvate kinase alpha/beta domain-containing protein n=1 Tax=unclassified Mesotoga TaxID=1184398 RepID=UPI000C195DD1|nr:MULTISPECIES: pyruvate kinase alpha/beta domain-containing protein [unclassified Mesotoga]PIJ62478.1 hypothetical protein V513_07675 [Mesotoga sp. H07.pep.5.3]RLL91776.1 hypothetical protein BG32_09635 [Mesotoga sp. HF07.pep.5.2.highcov]
MTMYFSKSDEETTKTLLERIFERAEEKKIDKVILPSTSGVVARMAFDLVPDSVRLIIVTHSVGFREPDEDEFDPQVRKLYSGSRHSLLTVTHLFRGIEVAFAKANGGVYPLQIFATALRLFGQGTKVAVEIAIMAADAGIVRTDQWVISAGGTNHGIDTAFVLKPCHSTDLSIFKFGELIGIPSSL